jgi:hypothetical protein
MLRDEECWRYLETEIDDLRKERDAYRADARESQRILKGISNCFGNMDCPTVQFLLNHFPFIFEALRDAHHHVLKQKDVEAGKEGALAVTLFEKNLKSEQLPTRFNNDETVYGTKGTDFRSHKDSRLCTLTVIDRELLVSCTCGRTKKYYSGEEIWYAFICNGIVILKYHKDSLPPPSHFQTEEPS